MTISQNEQKRMVAVAAAALVERGMVLGLGTGSTIDRFIEALPDAGVPLDSVTVVPTSKKSADGAAALGMTVVEPDGDTVPDLTIDGADEVARDLSMIKGGGGALLWEKIVAQASKRRVYIADVSKQVGRLGAFPLPVEVVPFGRGYTEGHLTDMGVHPSLRLTSDGTPFLTDTGNVIFDCNIPEISDPGGLDAVMCMIPGVVTTGLFVGLTDSFITLRDDKVVTVGDGEVFW